VIQKSAKNSEDPHLALLPDRATPLECGKSPAELFFGHQLRTTLPNVRHYQNANLKERKRKTKRYYDKSVKPLKSSPVRLYSKGSWKQKGTVLEEVSPRSYNVQTDDGAIYRRNRRHLLHMGDAQAMNMTSESTTPAPTPNVNQQDRTAANDLCSSNTPIRTSGRVVKKPERYIEICQE